MLMTKLLHPEILEALAKAGHGSKVLIADGNFPFQTYAGPNAKLVFLNLMPGVVNATDTLKALVGIVPIQSAHVMQPDEGPRPVIFDEFQKLLPDKISIESLPRAKFYESAYSRETALLIATAEQRLFGNVLLTIGVVQPG